MWAALTLALGFPTAHAQTVPDGATHTNVIAAPNGTPVVNIAAPNNAGVSHNTYQQFNVSSNGLILNNSGAISNTQLAGYITGNPNLGAGQSASIILNEVTSTQPSQLNGAMEVAGRAAQVIVANPNGITCGGCGFINAPRGTLVTGVPILDANGGLAGFNVTGGTITVNAQGLLSGNTDQVDLLARAVAINAGVWARQLNVVTGSNRIDYATLATQPLSATSATPAVALDVSALGGMYANAIRLIGTEAGLGVNSQGQIAAQNGDLSITSAGQVVLGGKTTATGNLGISAAQAFNNQGTLAAGGAVTLAGSDLSNSGTLYSGGAMTLSAKGQLSNSGQIEAQNGALTAQASGALNNTASASIYAGNAINLSGASLGNAGTIEAAQSASLQISGNASNSGTLQADAGNLGFSAATLANTGTLSATGNATLDGASRLSSTGTLVANGNISLTSPQLTTGGTVQAGGALALNGGALSNSGKLYALGGTWTATLSGAFINQSSGDVYSSQSLALNAASLSNAGTLEAQQGNAINLGGAFVNSGKLQSDQTDLTLAAASLSNSGTLSAYRNVQMQVSGTAQNSGVLVGGRAIDVSSGAFDNQSDGQIQSGTDLTMSAATLSNEGQVNAKGSATLSGATLSNAGGAQWIATGTLTLNQTGSVSNAGVLQAGSDVLMTQAASLSNAAGATMYAGQDFNLGVTQALTNNGTLYATRNATFTAGSTTNAGTMYGAQGFNLTAASLSNSGSLRSDGSLSVATQGNADNSGSAYALGTASWNVGGALSNSGVLAAASNVTLQASSLSGNGTLAAGLQSNGTLGSTGDLVATTTGNLAVNGRSLAAGKLQFNGSAIDLSNSQTRASTIALVANLGDINHAGGDLAANGTITITTPGSLINGGTTSAQGGKISAGTLVLQAAALNNQYGSLIQTGSSDLNLSFSGAFENANGSLSTNAQNLSIHAASVDNTSGTLQDAGSGTLSIVTSGNLANGNGKIEGNGALSLQTNGTLTNDGGTLSVSGNVTANAGTFSNVHGTLIGNNVGLTVAQALTNTGGGTIQSGGALTASANTLDNSGGFIKVTDAQGFNLTVNGALTNGTSGFIGGNGAATINAGSLINAGQIYAGTTLGVTAQNGLTNDHGAMQALGSLSIGSNGALSNRAGTIEAGSGNSAATMSLNAASLDDTNGRIANTGQGTTTVSVAQNVMNEGGTLGGQGALTLSASNLDNNSGKMVSGQALTLGLGGISNVGGTLYAAGDLTWNNSNASLDNTQGSLQSGGNLSFALASLNNAGGTLAANGSGNLSLGSFTGAGKVAAGQDLTLNLGSNYTNAVGNQLTANNNLTLNVSGNFTNTAGATLQAPNNLTVSAANIDNAAGATFNSNSTTLSTGGTLSNEGNIEGSTIALNAGALTNTANIIGGSITATAGSLTNGADLGTATSNNPYQGGLIAATNSIALYVSGALLNRDATIFTTGDLTLAGNASGGLSASITNLSGDIEANGSVTLNAQQFTNQRRVFQTTTYNLTTAEQGQNSTSVTLSRYPYYDTDPAHQVPNVQPDQVISSSEYAVAKSFCDNLNNNTSNQRCAGYPFGVGQPNTFQGIFTSTVTAVQEIAAISAQSKLMAGSNITINGSVLNDKSTIAAGNNLIINGQSGSNGGGSTSNYTVQNIAFEPTATVQTSINEQSATQQLQSNPRAWVDGPWMTYGTSSTSSTMSLAPGATPSWITFNAGNDAPATMSAGNTVSITAQTIDNTAVGANGQPVQNAIRLGSNSAGQTVSGGAATTVGAANGNGGDIKSVAISGAPGQASKPNNNSLAAPQVVSTLVGPNATVRLPQTGLYSLNVQPGSEFLIETNPQFTRYSTFISSDYMLQKLGLDPHQTEQRLGDGFYEQQRVLDQITDLTGRRYLADDTDALDQYRDLMNNAVQVAQQFNLSVGVALTPEQMANLTQDIVWLVNVNVDGHQVLEPVVYLSTADAKNLAASGATIAGKNVALNASGDVTNNGSIAARQNAQLTASNLLNSGTITAGNDLSLTTAQNILNGGTIKAGGNVSVVAGGDVLSGVSVAQSLGAAALPGFSTSIGPVALNNTALPGGITAGGSLAINAGRDLRLDTAPVKAGGNLSLAAGRDLTATATAISAGGNAQLLAGRDLSLTATGSTNRAGTLMNGVETTTHTVSTINAGGAVTLVAGNDLTSQGAQLTGSTVNLGAGHDATLTTVTDTTTRNTQGFQGHTLVGTGQSDQTVRGTTLTGSNGINVAANHDLTITAGQLNSANGNVALSAGNNLTLNAGNEDHSSYRNTNSEKSGLLSTTKTSTHDATSDSNVIGTAINGSNVTLAAGNDLTAQATQVHADQALALGAGHDIALTAAYDDHQETHDKQVSKSGFTFNNGGGLAPQSKRKQTESTVDQQTAVGTVLSGDTVTIAANHDITTQAAQVAGTHDVTLAAGHDLIIGAAEDTLTQSDSTTKTTTGYIRDSAFSETTGKKKEQQSASQTVTSYTGSLIGSTDGAVTLTAGNDAHITASELLSQTATTIVGKNVTIDAAVGSQDTKQSYSQSEAGITGGLGGGIVDSLQSAYYSGQRSSQVTDPRLKALYAAQAAYQAYDAYQGASSLANGGGQGSGDSVNVHVGIGASSSHGTTTTHDEQTYGSTIRSAGDVTIAATDGDLNVIGSQIKGQNVDLSAAHDLNLLSQGEAHTLQSNSKNASGGIGVQFGTDGFGIYAQAAMGQSKAHGNGETHTQTVVDATDTLTLIAGNDATLKGAQAKGDTVLADIGHNLNLISEQDTNDYASKQWQASGKVVIGFGGGSGNASYSQSNVNNHYASVTQMTGIGAGSGGYDIHVGGNTDLKGAAIASTASADKNLLDTGTLSYSNIQNQSQMSASTVGLSGGYSSGGGFGASPTLGIPQHGSQSSTTQAGIAQGTIDIRNNPGQDLAGLNRGPSLDNANGLKNTFNAQKVQEQQELGQVAGYVGMRAAGDISYLMQKQAAEDVATADKNGDKAAEVDAQARLAAWSDGGTDKVLLHGLVGAVTAALGNGNIAQGAAGALAGEGISAVMQDWLSKQGINPNSAEGKSLMQLASAAVGGAIGGGAGASTALQGEQFNRQLHPTELALIVGPMSEEYAKDYNAANPDHPISKNEAETALLKVALAQVDNQWAAKLGYGDPSAQSWLDTHYNNLNFKRSDGTDEQVFTATDAEKNDFGLYSDTYLSTFKNAVAEGARCRYGCTPTTFTTSNGLGFYSDYVSSNHGDLTLEGLYLKRQVSTLTPDQADTVAWLGGLKQVLNWSMPPAGVAISVADKQYGQAVMQAVGLLTPLGLEAGAFNTTARASSVYDTALWQSLGNNEALTLQNLQALYGEGNVVQGGGAWLQTAERVKGNVLLSQQGNAASNFDQHVTIETAISNGKSTGTVWDLITPTQPTYPGSVVPQSFEMSLPNGQSVWVHGNATEHLAEYAQMVANNNPPDVVRLTTQQQISSLQSAVNTATQDGVPYNQLINAGGWELKFAPPRQPGQLPALIHALYTGE